jgi:hypothetical protein
MLIGCLNCDDKESDLKTLFKIKYIHRSDIGAEYFQGNFIEMMQDIGNVSMRDLKLSSVIEPVYLPDVMEISI